MTEKQNRMSYFIGEPKPPVEKRGVAQKLIPREWVTTKESVKEPTFDEKSGKIVLSIKHHVIKDGDYEKTLVCPSTAELRDVINRRRIWLKRREGKALKKDGK